MRREFALVLETYNNNVAKVELQRSASCDGCTMCSKGKPIVLRAFNNINADKGDSVVIEVEELKKGTVLNTNTSSTQFQNMIYLVL